MSGTSIDNRKYSLLLTGILVLFLIHACIMLWRYYFILPDSAYLLALGKNIALGNGLKISGGFHMRYPPGYPAFAGIFYLLTRNLEASGHIASIVSGIGTILLVYAASARVYSRTTGILAGLLLALNPLFVWISSAALAEGSYALAYSGFVLAMIYLMQKPSWRPAALAGLASAVAYLTRAEGFLLLPIGIIVAMIAWRKTWKSIHHPVLILVVFLLTWFVVAFPYMVFLRVHLGGWTLSGKITQNIERVSEAIYSDDFESLRDNPLSRYESPGLIRYLVNNFPRVAERYAGFTAQAVSRAFKLGWPIMLLFLWFLVLGFLGGDRRGWSFLVFALPLLAYPLAHIEIRYLTPSLVAIVPPVAWGIEKAWSRKEGIDRALAIRRSLVVALIVILVAGIVLYVNRMPSPPTEHRILANWMLENLPDARTAKIAARFPYVSFYLDSENFRYIPQAATLDEAVRLAIERKLDYLVIDQRTTPIVQPSLEPLLDPRNAPTGLELVVSLVPPEVPSTIVLYRVLWGP
jgi:4-amino-4-deoxy-L-arabinose transferase-like glycosyltransferase